MTPSQLHTTRHQLHLTQEGLARLLGVSFVSVNRWENGRQLPSGLYEGVLDLLILAVHKRGGQRVRNTLKRSHSTIDVLKNLVLLTED